MKTIPCHVTENKAGQVVIKPCSGPDSSSVELPVDLVQRYQEAECFSDHVQVLIRKQLAETPGLIKLGFTLSGTST